MSFIRNKQTILTLDNDGKVTAATRFPSISQAKRFNRTKMLGMAQGGSVKIPDGLVVQDAKCGRNEQ